MGDSAVATPLKTMICLPSSHPQQKVIQGGVGPFPKHACPSTDPVLRRPSVGNHSITATSCPEDNMSVPLSLSFGPYTFLIIFCIILQTLERCVAVPFRAEQVSVISSQHHRLPRASAFAAVHSKRSFSSRGWEPRFRRRFDDIPIYRNSISKTHRPSSHLL